MLRDNSPLPAALPLGGHHGAQWPAEPQVPGLEEEILSIKMDFANYISRSPSWALNSQYSQGTAKVKRLIHSFWLLVHCQNRISDGFVLPSFLQLGQTYVLKAVAEHFLQTKYSLRKHGNLFLSITCPNFLQNSPKSFLCGFEPTWSCCSRSNSFNQSFASISGPLITSVVEAVPAQYIALGNWQYWELLQ